jgi:hypothetical protein
MDSVIYYEYQFIKVSVILEKVYRSWSANVYCCKTQIDQKLQF